MKIRCITYSKNDKLGNLKLDLTNGKSDAYDKIIILGENGFGKTTILKDINKFINGNEFQFHQLEFLNDNGEMISATEIEESRQFGFHDLTKDGVTSTNNTNYNNNPKCMSTNPDDIRMDGCVFSTAQVNFKTDKVSTIGSEVLNVRERTRSSGDNNLDFTQIKKLLIDVENQDAELFMNLNKENNLDYAKFENDYSKIFVFKKND